MGKTAAHWAVIRNSSKVIDLLIDQKTDLSVGDFTGKTPLSYAILQEDDAMVKVRALDRVSAGQKSAALERSSDRLPGVLQQHVHPQNRQILPRSETGSSRSGLC